MPSQLTRMADLGERLRRARVRLHMDADILASRAGISLRTLTRIENGDAAVAIRSYLRVLGVLYLEEDLDRVAQDVDLIRRMYETSAMRLPPRRALPMRK